MKNPGESRPEQRKPSERTTEQLEQLKDISEDDLSTEEAYNQAMAELEQETVSPEERLDEYFAEVPAVAVTLPRPEELRANPDALYERELELRAEYAKFLATLPADLRRVLPSYDRLSKYIQREDEEDKSFSAALPSIKLKNTGLLARDAVANRFNSFVAGAEILAEAAQELKFTRTQKEQAA